MASLLLLVKNNGKTTNKPRCYQRKTSLSGRVNASRIAEPRLETKTELRRAPFSFNLLQSGTKSKTDTENNPEITNEKLHAPFLNLAPYKVCLQKHAFQKHKMSRLLWFNMSMNSYNNLTGVSTWREE